jgi:hypothetical protein
VLVRLGLRPAFLVEFFWISGDVENKRQLIERDTAGFDAGDLVRVDVAEDRFADDCFADFIRAQRAVGGAVNPEDEVPIFTDQFGVLGQDFLVSIDVEP